MLKTKRTLALLVSVIMLLGCFSPSVFALESGNFTYTVSEGVATITGLTDAAKAAVSAGTLTELEIPSAIDDVPVTQIGANAFYTGSNPTVAGGNTAYANIKKITIPEGITRIWAKAFTELTGVERFDVPASVTRIGQWAFARNTGTVVLHCESVRLETAAFCWTPLKELVILGNVTLDSTDYPFNNDKGKDDGGGGRYRVNQLYCSTAVETFLKPYIEKGMNGSTAYPYNCYQIWYDADNKITYSLDGVETPVSDFIYTIGTNAVTLDGLSDSAKTALGALEEGEKLAFEIPSAVNGLPVTKIANHAFNGNTNKYDTNENTSYDKITTIKIPDSVTTIGQYAFHDLDGLDRIDIPSSVTSVGARAFSNATADTVVVHGKPLLQNGAFIWFPVDNLVFLDDDVTSNGYAFNKDSNDTAGGKYRVKNLYASNAVYTTLRDDIEVAVNGHTTFTYNGLNTAWGDADNNKVYMLDGTGVLIVAKYDGGKLVSVDTSKTLSKGNIETITPDATYATKVFVWSSLSSLTPLGNSFDAK